MNKNFSDQLVKRSRASVWHPYTQMKHHEYFPMVALSHGAGCWLFDYDGNRYLDSISSWWVNLFGHCNPTINQAITDQLARIEHTMLAGFTHEPVVQLSEKLSQLTGNTLGHIFYASDGASSIEIALKMSFHYWFSQGKKDKTEFVTLKNGYHGETLGALSVSDISLYKDIYGPMLRSVNVIEGPDSRRVGKIYDTDADMTRKCLKDLEEFMEQKHAKIAAFILEPLVQGAAGMVMYSPDYLLGARNICDRYGVHMIADEIAVGCGRTGTMFASEQAGIWADFMTLSKGISGGYLPLSLVMTTDEIYEAFYDDDTAKGFLHSHTYTANPLACRSALAVLEIFEKENILKQNQTLSNKIQNAFKWVDSDPRLTNFRSKGMMFAFDVSAGFEDTHFPRKVFQEACKHELLLRPIGQTVYFVPPYVINDAEISHLVMATKDTLNGVLK